MASVNVNDNYISWCIKKDKTAKKMTFLSALRHAVGGKIPTSAALLRQLVYSRQRLPLLPQSSKSETVFIDNNYDSHQLIPHFRYNQAVYSISF